MAELDPRKLEQYNKLKEKTLSLNAEIEKGERQGTITLQQLIKLQDRKNKLVDQQNKLLGISKKTSDTVKKNWYEQSDALKDIGEHLSIIAGKDKNRIKIAQTINREAGLFTTLAKDGAKNSEKMATKKHFSKI